MWEIGGGECVVFGEDYDMGVVFVVVCGCVRDWDAFAGDNFY